MKAIDTNVLVRLLARDEPRQISRADAFIADGAWVSHLVLAETVWVLESVYELGQAQIEIAIEMLLGHATIVIQEPDVVSAAFRRYKMAKSVDFSDCLILEIARHAGHNPLATFDRALAKLEDTERL